jgi:formylglycine-generating enzyme required for sulfatase activity
MIAVGTFCIDRWEAALLAEDGKLLSPFERPDARIAYRATSRAAVTPQGYISRIEASSACARAEKRLCRAREWFAACQGAERQRCNTGKPHVLTQLFGKRVTLTYDAHYNNPRVNREPGFLATTGEHVGCTSSAGAFDMIGNLHEWVADDVSSRLSKEVPLEYGQHRLGPKGSGVFMGGYYSSKAEHGHGCAYVTATHAPDYHDYSTGFRCCADQGNGVGLAK